MTTLYKFYLQRMLIVKISLFLLSVIAFSSCGSITKKRQKNYGKIQTIAFPKYEKLNNEDKILADSILGVALDNEALYSLMGSLKPISSIGFSLSYPLAKDSLQLDGQENVIDLNNEKNKKVLKRLKRLNRVLNALSFADYKFYLIPFKRPWKGNRNMQILVCRKDLLDELLKNKASFFGQWGFVPENNPAVILTTIEFEQRNDRYRAYGYLFGYPDHAVDFFVNASIEYKKTNKFVKRSFFHIPVFTKEKGSFTYALPKGFTPLKRDSILLKKAQAILGEYKSLRTKYLSKEGKLEAVKLFREWWKKQK